MAHLVGYILLSHVYYMSLRVLCLWLRLLCLRLFRILNGGWWWSVIKDLFLSLNLSGKNRMQFSSPCWWWYARNNNIKCFYVPIYLLYGCIECHASQPARPSSRSVAGGEQRLLGRSVWTGGAVVQQDDANCRACVGWVLKYDWVDYTQSHQPSVSSISHRPCIGYIHEGMCVFIGSSWHMADSL